LHELGCLILAFNCDFALKLDIKNELGFKIPVAAAEHRSPPRGIRETPDRARGALFAPGELGERRGGREAQEDVGGSGACFLLVSFLCTSKDKETCRGSATHK